MSWMAVAIGGSAALGAAGSAYASNQAAGAQIATGKKGLAEQQRQYNIGLNMLEPQRALGYGAMSDLANLYGYSLPAYTPVNALLGGYGSGPYSVRGGGGGGGSGGGQFGNPLNALPGGSLSPLGVFGHKDPITKAVDSLFGGGKPEQLGGKIDPYAGTVDVKGGKGNKDAIMTHYLRTGEWTGGKGKKLRTLRREIDRIRNAGYQYDPNPPGQSPAAQQAGAAPGNMSRFFTSPDYNFRRSEGIRGIEQGAAARGGALSGNALRATTDYSSNLASGEYGDYFNRLLNLSDMGSRATNQSVQAGQSYANNASNLWQNMGDARASGIVSTYGGVSNALNSGLQNYMLYRGGWFNRPTGA